MAAFLSRTKVEEWKEGLSRVVSVVVLILEMPCCSHSEKAKT